MIISGGLLMYKIEDKIFVYLVHPGGPYFKNKDKGWWTIPKGLPDPDEEILNAAIREFEEETGVEPEPPYLELGNVKQKGGKIVYCWAFEYNSKADIQFKSNRFQIEWPPASGKTVLFPEVDKAEWMEIDTAKQYINERQKAFLDRLNDLI